MRSLRWASLSACLRIAAVCVLPFLLATCGEDNPSGPSGSPVVGRMEFVSGPILSGGFFGPNLPIDRVHVVIVRPPSTIVKDTSRAFNPNANQLRLDLPILLRAAAESLDVTLELLSGTTVLFSGTSRLEARSGPPSTTPPPAIPLVFIGPGSDLASLLLEPVDSTLTQGDSLSMRVSATDISQAPVPSFYVGWSSSDTTVATVNGAGVVRGRVPRGMVYIRARSPATLQAPTGVVESTTVSLTPAPASLLKTAGDNQGAPVNSLLPQLLEVEVRGSDNLPVAGVTVAFAALSPGAIVDSATATTDQAGRARTGATLGGTVGVQTFTATVAGLPVATFTATASSAPAPTWTGAVSTDWHTPANWNLGFVPASADSVTIPAGPANQPVVSVSNATTGALLNNGTITLSGSAAITAFGNVRGSGTITGGGNAVLAMPLAGTMLDLSSVPNVFISAAVTLGRTVNVTGQLNIGSSGSLAFANHTANVSSSFSTTGAATIVMTSPTDSLKVQGSVLFDGGNTLGLITSGVIFVRGDFTQGATTSARSYAPTGNHLVVLNGTSTQDIAFATPGAAGSNFETVVLANPSGNIHLLSDIFQAGPVAFAPGVPRIVHGNGHTLFTAELLANNATLDDLLVVANNVQITQFDSITFTNYSPSATPLTILHPGAATPFVFNNLVFTVTPTTGFYMSVTDNAADANTLTIEMVNPTPGAPGGLVQTAGGAVVNWPAVTPGARDWTGAVSTDWSNPANWNPALVPTGLDDVTITPATNQPVLTAASAANSVVISGLGASLTIGGRTLTVNSLITHTDGLLVMTNPADLVVVNGPATFQGGDQTGLLSAGELRVDGDFNQQQQTTNNSFVASGSHRTVLTGSILQGVRFCCSAGASGFRNLDLSGSAGINYQFSGNGVQVFDTLIAQVGAGPAPLLYALGNTLTAARLRVDKLIVDRGTLVLNEGGVPATQQFNNVTFQNYLTSQTQFSIVAPGGSPRTLTFFNLHFQLLSTGNTGRYINVSAPSGTLIVDLPGATPAGGNGPAFTATSGAVTVNWPSGPSPATIWTGAVSTDWSDPANWTTNAVPTFVDSVEIPAGGNQPTLTGASQAGILVLANGTLTMNGQSLAVGGNFYSTGSGRLVMTNPADGISIGGNATFDGANQLGFLTDGAMILLGDLTQLATNSPDSYHPSGTHALFLAGTANQTITFATPGLVPGSSHLQEVVWNASAPLTLGSDVYAHGSFLKGNSTSETIAGAGRLLSVASFSNAQGTITFDGVRLEVIQPAAIPIALDDLSFINQAPDVVQLRIDHPGQGFPFTFNDLSFGTVPTTGLYLQATDLNPTDGQPLMIDLVNPSPGTDGGFIQALGGAVINWPAAGGGGSAIWTGAVDDNWNDPGNWQGGNVPNPGDDILLPAGMPNYPGLASNEVVGNMVVEPGALLDFVDATLEVQGDLTGGGSMTNGGPEMTGTGVTLEMADLGNLVISGFVTLTADLVVSGNILIQGAPAHFDINGFDLGVGNDFVTTTLGTFQMTTGGGSIDVGGSAVFEGGPENGLLTQGTLSVKGNFTQGNSSSPNSFRANGLVVVLDGTAQQTVTFSDSLLSFFDDLDLDNTTGGILMASLVRLNGNLAIAAGVNVTAVDATASGDGFDVLGGVFASSGSTLAVGRLYLVGSMSMAGTWNTASVIFQGTGQTAPVLPYNQVYVQTGDVTFAGGAVGMSSLVVSSGVLNLGGRTTVNGDVFVTGGTLKPNGRTLAIVGALNLQATGTLTMQNPLDSVLVNGFAGFGGGSTVGLLTNGVIQVGGSFTQSSGTSATSFAASGSHKTIVGAGAVRVLNFATPGSGGAGSHFGNLDVTLASGGLTLTNDIVVDGTLIATPTGTAPTITGGVSARKVTAMALGVSRGSGTSLVFDNAPLVVNEQGTIRFQTFDRAAFQGFPTGATSAILMDLTLAGTSVTPRPLTFTAPTVQTSLGSGGLYARLVSSNGPLAVTVTISGSNDPTGGPSRSNPSFGNTVNGARIVWQ